MAKKNEDTTQYKITFRNRPPRIDTQHQTVKVQGKAAKNSTVKELRSDKTVEVIRVERKVGFGLYW